MTIKLTSPQVHALALIKQGLSTAAIPRPVLYVLHRDGYIEIKDGRYVPTEKGKSF